jgi:hypothetical protein
VEAETRLQEKVNEAKILTQQIDSLKGMISKKQAVIDYLENNPTIIIKQNDKAHLNIDRLNAYNSIVLFSDNIARYENNRGRYSLHRFNK